ncbi:MAG: alpha/beta hydrolase family protein [Tepidisphaerales bacterium]
MRLTALFTSLLVATTCLADPKLPWDLEALSKPLAYRESTEFSEPGVKAIEFDGLPYQGKPTRVFAWLGLPKEAAAGKVPAIVLVHGGGGTAHARWVRLWNSRGYAAIAMDTCGKFGGDSKSAHRGEFSGPPGWDAAYQQIDAPIEDQWPYHAVADAVLAHSLIRSLPEVDAQRIGVTGISWGGYLTCIIAGVDSRFKLAAPVYGCGFLRHGSAWVPAYEKMGPEKSGKWLALWDPSVYLPNAKMPMLWIDSNVDFAYPLGAVQESYRLPQGERFLSTIPGMKHSHPAGEVPEEIHAFADQILMNGAPLPQMVSMQADAMAAHGVGAKAVFKSKTKLVKAELVYTTDSGPWQKRKWKVEPAELDSASGTASCKVPVDAVAFYLNVIDERNLVASSEHVEFDTNRAGGRN